MEWTSNPENQGKIDSIFKFLKDWWPVLLTAYLAFGNGLSRFVLGLTGKLVVWSGKLLATVIPALFKAIAAMGPWGWAALGTAAVVGGGMYLHNKNKNKEGGEETGDGEWTTLPSVVPRSFEDAYSEEDQAKINEMLEAKNFNKGGQVPGSGNTDTVPAMLTPGEFVMSKGAVQQYGVDTLAGMNAAAGGTNIPTLKNRFNEGGVVTDPKEKKAQEDYMLHWVNKERVEVLGLPPLKKLTYADGVELTKKMGPGPKVTETSDTNLDFDNMMKTTSRSKTVGDKSIFAGSVGLLTDEDKQQYLASNPGARMMMEMRDRLELNVLGADISASAKMNGGGLVQGFNGGGLVQPVVEPGSINSYEDAIKAGVKVEDTVAGNIRYGSINWTEKIPKGLFGFFGKQKYEIKGTEWMLDGIGKEHNEILAIPTKDFVNIRMGWDGSSSSSIKPKGQGNKIRAVSSKSGDPNIGQLSKKKPKVVVVDNPNEEVDASQAQLPSQGNREIPSFDATSIRSLRKMEVLGISI